MLFNSCTCTYNLNNNTVVALPVQIELEILNHRTQTHRLLCSTFPAVSVCLAGQHWVWNFQCSQNLKLSEPGWKSERCHPETSSKGKTQSHLQRHGTHSLVSYSLSISLTLLFSFFVAGMELARYWNTYTHTNLYQHQHMHTCLKIPPYTPLTTWGLS